MIWRNRQAGFSRPLDIVKVHLWSARPRRGPCLAIEREKPVKLIQSGHTTLYPKTGAALAADLAALGIAPGMALMVHSSLGAIGWVVGGAPVVVRTLIEALGDEGTLVMPAASPECLDPASWPQPVAAEWHATLRDHLPPFDPATTPSAMGAITESFRIWPGTQRSDHPISSVCARGPQAQEIVSEHALDVSEGRGTPFEKLYDLDAHTLLLGVGFNRCTSLHFAESLSTNPRMTTSRYVMMRDGERVWHEAPAMADDNDTMFPAIGAAFEATGKLRKGSIGNAEARLFATRDLVDFATAWFDAQS